MKNSPGSGPCRTEVPFDTKKQRELIPQFRPIGIKAVLAATSAQKCQSAVCNNAAPSPPGADQRGDTQQFNQGR
jgi:hypothetical protein